MARSDVTLATNGSKKRGKFPILRNGEYICATVVLDTLTNYAKLQVGNHIVTTKRAEGSENPLFPLMIDLEDDSLAPLRKVWVDYEPESENQFVVKIND